MTGPRHHPFVVSIDRDAEGTFKFSSTPIDVLFGDAKSQWSFSVSGNSFAFTRQRDETSEVAFKLEHGSTTVIPSCSNWVKKEFMQLTEYSTFLPRMQQ
jgi:hypothetical protein